MKQNCFIIFLFLYFSTNCRCQEVKDTDFEIFDESSGLSNRSITGIVQDKRGYLWIATIDGLNQYDGYSFKVFKHFQNDTSSILDNFVRSIAIDRDGNLWVGYRSGGMSLYDYEKNAFRNFRPEQLGSPKKETWRIYADRANTIWVCIARRGLYRLNKKNNTLVHVCDLVRETGWSASGDGWDNTIHDIREDSTGVMWLSTENGLYTYEKQKAHLNAIRSKGESTEKKAYVLRRVAADNNGLWISSIGSGLLYYDFHKKNWSQFKFQQKKIDGNLIYNVLYESDSSLWVGTEEHGLGVFFTKSRRFSFNSRKFALASDILYKDSFGILWASSDKGLIKFNPKEKKFSLTSLKVSRQDVSVDNQFLVTCFLYDSSSHSLFMGTTYADGLHVINEINGDNEHYEFEKPPGEPFLRTRAVFKDSKGNIWVVTSGFLYKFDKKMKRLVKLLHPANSFEPFFQKIIEDHEGNLWMTSAVAGLFKFNTKNQTYTQYSHSPGDSTSIPENHLVNVIEDKFNRMWVATANEGVGIFDPEKKSFTRITGFNEKLITSMTRGPADDIWISSLGGGIVQLTLESRQTTRLKVWDVNESTLSKNVLWLYFENKNSIWFATHSSMSHLSLLDGKITSYGVTDGLYSEFRFYSIYESRGYLYVGTRGGYYKFIGSKIKSDTIPPRIVLNYFKSNDEDLLPGFTPDGNASISLKYSQNSFTFEFTALNFIIPSKNQYAYKLEGFDKNWSHSGTRRYGNYTNLDPGTYTLRLKGSNGNNIWNEKGISIAIEIEKPFWRTWWFYFATGLVVFSIAYGFYRSKIQQVRREEALIRKFAKKKAELKMQALRAQINPHFIFNCLNSVNRYILTNELKQASQYLTKFSRLIRGVLENSQTQMVSLESELSTLKLYIELEAARFEKKFDYHISLDPDINALSVQIPPLIIQPFVENAIWHGLLNKREKGSINISLGSDGHIIKCIVEDDGVGREVARKLKGNSISSHESMGIEITRQRLLHLYQKKPDKPLIQITDLYDANGNPRGTSVEISIPYSAKTATPAREFA